MATSFDGIVSGGGFKPSTTNTPIDVRTRIESISEVGSIPQPYVGMIFYVIDEDAYYVVQTLKSQSIGPITVENALVDTYRPLLQDVESGKTFSEIAADVAEIQDQIPTWAG